MTYAHVRAKAMESHEGRQTMYRKSGGEVHSDAAEDRALIREMVKPKDLKKGETRVEGRARGGKADRPGKAKTIVNVIVPPNQNAAPPPAMMSPHPPVIVAPPPHPMMPPPGQPGMAPMAGPPPGGMMPGGIMPRARGGRTKREDGGATDDAGRRAFVTNEMAQGKNINQVRGDVRKLSGDFRAYDPDQMKMMTDYGSGPAPGGKARGGRAHRDMGGATPNFGPDMTPQAMQNSQAMGQAPGPQLPGVRPAMKAGGAARAHGGRLDAGAASGEGRLEKARNERSGRMIEYGD